ncbi:MAG: hypothetical protein IJD36_06675 [Clostridia bacterium]|nr:hypothetical protein [Clostridia bacterium]
MKNRVWKIIWLVILAVVAIGIGVLAYMNANNIKALTYMNKSPEQHKELLLENEKKVQEILDKLPAPTIKPLSEEDEKKLQNGEISQEEALSIIMGKNEKPQNSQQDKKPGPVKIEEDNTNEEEYDPERLQNLIAQIYLLRSSFTGQINGLVAQAKQEYINQTKKDLPAIAAKYIGIASGLESSCDGQIESLLSQIKTELEKAGADTSMVNDIRSAYYNEKSITKAALLAKYSR